jgi:hypothetical protein
MRIKTSDFPKLKVRNYAAIREHFDSVKPWNSKYNPDNERPIGQRACKLTSDGERWGCTQGYGVETAEDRAADRDGARFNKAMRMLRDESIAFRLYDHDCVVYHPDNTLTIHGYASVSTNDFISALTPTGISQKCRHEMYDGRRGAAFEPVLHLHPTTERWYPSDYHYPEVRDRKAIVPDWSAGIVVQCEQPVTLHYSVKKCHFVPTRPDELEPFETYQVDRRAAREVSRKYHLSRLEQVIHAVLALANLPAGPGAPWAPGSVCFSDIMDALREERYVRAIQLMPRGTKKGFGGKIHGSDRGIEPGFLRRLRNHIYDHEGVVRRVSKPVLTSSQYDQYKAHSKQFDDA